MDLRFGFSKRSSGIEPFVIKFELWNDQILKRNLFHILILKSLKSFPDYVEIFYKKYSDVISDRRKDLTKQTFS